ncbi:MAG: four helix bundle protein [Proteobacteria bacterium]|nr:four helix bundle protein [Pseudomonadota bacterium]
MKYETRSTIETLEAWKMARNLRKGIARPVKTFPQEEKFRLVDQMIRASRYITANIAEGNGRYHCQENIQFCRQARGSLYEMLDYITVVLDEDYIEQKVHENLRKMFFENIKVINGYINYLKNQKETTQLTQLTER